LAQNKTETLQIGSTAPPFVLAAANWEGQFFLEDLLARRPLVLEFLRGTW
jgi:hypothetical protein